MDKVAIYARVSTENLQDYTRQINDLTKTIIKDNFSEDQIEIFAEKLSGYKKERPELTRLLENAESFKCIYVTEISRLGRNPSHTRQIIDELTEKGIPVFVQSLGQSTLTNGKRNAIMSIVLQVLMEFAHIEAETTKTRMKSGKVTGVSKQKSHGNNLAFGYKSDENKMLVIDETEALIIQQIFELYKEGNGTKVIANTLNQMGILTRLNKTHADKTIKYKNKNIEIAGDLIKWDGNTIRQIIKNTIYKGERKFKGQIYKAPSIIDNELFDYCNELMTSKVTRNYKVTYEYLLRDLIYCGKCGRKYFAKYSIDKRGDKVYKCTSKIKSGGGCGNISINISQLESIIYDQILNSDTLLKYFDNPNDVKKEIERDLKILEQEYKNENMVVQEKENELSKLLDLYLKNEKYQSMFEVKEIEISKAITAAKDKINLINKDIISKKLTISKYDRKTASRQMILNAMHNRNELVTIFKQFIDKIIINNLNEFYTLATVFIKINGVQLKTRLKLAINIKGVRAVRHSSRKEYKYLPILKMINEPVFNNNILIVNSNDILLEVEDFARLATQENYELINQIKIEIVPRENWLYINEIDL